MLLCKDPTPHPPNQNKTKEINVYFTYSSTNNTEGILIKIPCVNFCTHVMWDVKSTISGRRRTATDRDGSGIRDWNDLEDEQKRGASVLSLFSFSFFFFLQHPGLDVWKTSVQRSYWRLNVLWRDKVLKLSAICKRLGLNGIRLNQVRRFCAENEEDWAEHRALWDTLGNLRNLWYVVISNEWHLTVFFLVRWEENQESAVALQQMPYRCWSLLRSMQRSVLLKAAKQS